MSDSSSTQDVFVHPLDALSATQAGEQFLRLGIGSNLPVLLPIQQLTEVLSIPEHQIMPIPHLPAWVMGAYNWRGEILWMIDLGHLCGFSPWYQYSTSRSTHSAVVLTTNASSYLSAHSSSNHFLTTDAHSKGQMLGLVVRQVEDIEWCNLTAVQSLFLPSMVNLQPFSVGCWQKSEHEVLAILDGAAILKAMPQ